MRNGHGEDLQVRSLNGQCGDQVSEDLRPSGEVDYTMALVTTIRNKYFHIYYNTIAHTMLTLSSIVDATSASNSLSHDLINDVRIGFTNLSIIIDAMQSFLSMHFPHITLPYCRHNWDKWTVLEYIRGVVEEMDGEKRLDRGAAFLSSVLPLPFSDEMFRAYNMSAFTDRNASRIDKWKVLIVMCNQIISSSEPDQIDGFFAVIQRMSKRKIYLQSDDDRNRLSEDILRLDSVEKNRPMEIRVWTDKLRTLTEPLSRFDLFLEDKYKQGDQSFKPKDIHSTHPIIDKNIYINEVEGEDYLVMMMDKFGYKLVDGGEDRARLVKRLSQLIGLVIKELLHLFKGKFEILAEILLCDQVLEFIQRRPVSKTDEAIFTLSGTRPLLTLHCLHLGPTDRLTVYNREIFLTRGRNTWQETFHMGRGYFRGSIYSDTIEIICGISLAKGRVLAICDQKRNGATEWFGITCIDCVKMVFVEVKFLKLQFERMMYCVRHSPRPLLAKIENTEKIIIAGYNYEVGLFVMEPIPVEQDLHYGLHYYAINDKKYFDSSSEPYKKVLFGTTILSNLYTYQEYSSMCLMILASISRQPKDKDKGSKNYTVYLTVVIRVIDTENYYDDQRNQMFKEESVPFLEVDFERKRVVSKFSEKEVKMVPGGFEKTVSAIQRFYDEVQLRYFGNLRQSDCEDSSHNYLGLKYSKRISSDPVLVDFFMQFPVAFKLYLPGDLPKKIWKQFKAKIVDWEPAHFSPIPFHAFE